MTVNINWCLKNKDGIRLVSANDNLAQSYIKMAENAIGTMNRERNYNLQFAISACYYSMYYSLYAVLMKIGVKCEIHSCTLEFMNIFLKNYYSVDDIKIINRAMRTREIAQYYADKIVSKEDMDIIMTQAPLFINKSKDILSKLNQQDIEKIRDELNKYTGANKHV